jgi:hypothetical protein
MYRLEHLQPRQANGLPLYPVRLTTDTYTVLNATDLSNWSTRHNVVVARSGPYLYFNSEQDATLFILGHNDGST